MKNVTNEPILDYRKGSVERIALEQALDELSKKPVPVPVVIGSQKFYGESLKQAMVSLFEPPYKWVKVNLTIIFSPLTMLRTSPTSDMLRGWRFRTPLKLRCPSAKNGVALL
jgi:hypothetical protein